MLGIDIVEEIQEPGRPIEEVSSLENMAAVPVGSGRSILLKTKSDQLIHSPGVPNIKKVLFEDEVNTPAEVGSSAINSPDCWKTLGPHPKSPTESETLDTERVEGELEKMKLEEQELHTAVLVSPHSGICTSRSRAYGISTVLEQQVRGSSAIDKYSFEPYLRKKQLERQRQAKISESQERTKYTHHPIPELKNEQVKDQPKPVPSVTRLFQAKYYEDNPTNAAPNNYQLEQKEPEPVPTPLKKKVHPQFDYNVGDWDMWQYLGCSEDFVAYPPLLQLQYENFTTVHDQFGMKCQICKLICPPPPYRCYNGHVICFSCTSVIKKCLCPMYDARDVHGEQCGQLLTLSYPFDYESKLSDLETLYPCPYGKLGCVISTPVLLPFEVVDHAQKSCGFRYKVNCFVDDCVGQKDPIRIGQFLDHVKECHGRQTIDLQSHLRKKRLDIYVDLSHAQFDLLSVPFIFLDLSNTPVIFPLVMKADENFVHFWIYKIIDRDAPPENYRGDIAILPNSFEIHSDNTDSKPTKIAERDTIHEYSESIENVIESEHLISIPFSQFVEQYLTSCETDDGGPTRKYFCSLQVNICKKSKSLETERERTALWAEDQLRLLRKYEENEKESPKLITDLSKLRCSIDRMAIRMRQYKEDMKNKLIIASPSKYCD